MLFRESPKPIQAYAALAELALDSFRQIWSDWNSTFETFSATHPEAGRELRDLQYKVDQRRYTVTHAKVRSVAVFVENRTAILEELRNAVAMVKLIDDFAQTTSAYTKSWLSLAPTRLEALREGLASLEISTSHLDLTHAVVSEHTQALVDEYVLDKTAHPQIVTLHRTFFSDLFSARDAYFSKASLEILQRYTATAQELVEKNNPLHAYAHTSFVKLDEEASARAVALLDKLICDELMVGLLEDREELSHAE